MTESDILALLSKRYVAPAYTFLTHVRNGTGFQKQTRTADAMAMSVWPSRGLHLSGFEIKVSRADWLKEMKHPEKAEELSSYCHFWWMVAPEGIIKDFELPQTWGLMEITEKNQLRIKVQAPGRKAKAPDWDFIASLLRNVADGMVPIATIQDKLKAAREDGMKAQRSLTEYAEKQTNELKEAIRVFEEKSGVQISTWSAGDIGEAVRFVRSGGLTSLKRELEWLHDKAADFHSETKKAVEAYAKLEQQRKAKK